MTAIKLDGAYLGNGECSTRVTWDGGDFSTADYESIDASDKVTKQKVPGQGRYAVGRTSGYYEADDAKIGMYLDKFCELQLALSTKAKAENKHLTDVVFNIRCSWASGDIVHTLLLESCQLIGRSLGTKSGDPKAEVLQWPVSVMKLYLDGVCLVDDTGVTQ